MLEPAMAGLCPNDGSAVTLHLDVQNDDGLGIVLGLSGDNYYGTCNTCRTRIVKQAAPVVTTVGGGPHPLEAAFAREVRAGRRATDAAPVATIAPEDAELHAEVSKLSVIEREELLANLRSHNAQAAGEEPLAAEDEPAPAEESPAEEPPVTEPASQEQEPKNDGG